MTQPLQIFSMLMVFIFLCTSTYGQESWMNFKVETAPAFSVDVPGEMKKDIQKIKTSVGSLDVCSYAYQGNEEDANYLYLINIVEYPESTFPTDSLDLIEEYLKGAIESTIDRVGGELLYASSDEIGGTKLYRIKYNDGNAIIKGKSLIKDDTFYNVQVFTTKNKSLNEEMDYFLDSFRLL